MRGADHLCRPYRGEIAAVSGLGLDQQPGGPAGSGRPDAAAEALADLVAAAALRYLSHGHGSPILLVHTVTAPNAVLRTLPALPRHVRAAAWATSAALTCAYAPGQPAPLADLPISPTGSDAVKAVLDRAVAHGDEHAIKLADATADVYDAPATRRRRQPPSTPPKLLPPVT